MTLTDRHGNNHSFKIYADLRKPNIPIYKKNTNVTILSNEPQVFEVSCANTTASQTERNVYV